LLSSKISDESPKPTVKRNLIHDVDSNSKGKTQIEEGSKVEANYKGKGKFYPGRVKRDRGDGTFDIDYNDGEQEIRVPEEMIRLTDMGSMSLKSKTALEEGTKVEGNYKGKGRWYPAVIKRYVCWTLFCSFCLRILSGMLLGYFK